MLRPAIDDMARRYPQPSRAQAAAVLSSYSEATVPLPAHLAPEWWGTADTTPGRWWALVWIVAGYKRAGDKFAAPDSITWWRGPLPPADAAFFWSELQELASASDDWQLRQGEIAATPVVDAGPYTPRGGLRRPQRLVKFLRDGWEALKRWRAARPSPSARPATLGDGAIVVIVAAALALSRRRRGR
jgi:hypothetical protein